MWTLWQARDGNELHAIVSALPLWPYMELTVHPLAAHPIDPAPPAAG
jgi:muconolactone D-isomerase